jgi:transposase-like protein
MRAVVVRRLLSVGETGGVTRVHVRIAAEAVGVSERTMWRWLAQGRGGQITPTPRSSGGFFLDDAAWERLGLLGGNVSALYRWMTHERGSGPAEEKAVVPSPATFLRVVRRDLRAGRVLQVARPAPGHADPGGYDCALAELALPRLDSDGALDLTDVAPVPVTEPLVGAAGGGVRLYAPGARLVSTRQLAAVAEAVARTVAARGSICVFGETGCGKTLAVEQALHLLSCERRRFSPSRAPSARRNSPVRSRPVTGRPTADCAAGPVGQGRLRRRSALALRPPWTALTSLNDGLAIGRPGNPGAHGDDGAPELRDPHGQLRSAPGWGITWRQPWGKSPPFTCPAGFLSGGR